MKRVNNATIRKNIFKRDNFTCQKCRIQDTTCKKLELHHINPIYQGGTDNLNNLITLCFDCHKYAPDKKQEFDEYMKEEMEGTLTTLAKFWKKAITENPELVKEINKK